MIKYSDIKTVYEQQRLFLQNDESLRRESLASLPTDKIRTDEGWIQVLPAYCCFKGGDWESNR